MRKRISIKFYEIYGRFMFYLFISSGDHTEVISIDFDPTRISYEQLLDLFWNNHEYGLTKKMKRQVSKLLKMLYLTLLINNLRFLSLVHVINFNKFG